MPFAGVALTTSSTNPTRQVVGVATVDRRRIHFIRIGESEKNGPGLTAFKLFDKRIVLSVLDGVTLPTGALKLMTPGFG